MDGINGITVLYSLVAIGTFFYVDKYIVDFHQDYFLIAILSALVVFAFFNFRKKAICFAGDVGSVSIAFIICYLLLKLFTNTEFVYWIFLLGIYGLDTLFTIICRIFRQEPLTQAHRSHFYQYLANEAGWGHLKVSILYGFIQLGLNFVLIGSYINMKPMLVIVTFVVILIIYSIFRLRLEGFKRLFVSYNPD
jgi:UDP-N-acetylmuramyl pentapeptide phosphotransferase/UDP-N-acetylglucosamine-1-phosphate transferase